MDGPDKYYLTVVAPIDYVRGGSQHKLRRLEQCLDFMPTRQPFGHPHDRGEVPFAVMPMVHMVRFLIIDEIPVQMGNEESGQLASKYLLFIAELDGGRDSFLRCFFDKGRETAIGIFGNCTGFPDDCSRTQFVRYIKQHEIQSTLPFSAYSELTQPQVQNMLDVRSDLTAFVTNHQNSSAQSLFDEWRQFVDGLETLDMSPRERRRTRRAAP